WVLGPLLIMPIMMGMSPQFGNAFTSSNMMSLVGHLIYGGIAGLVYAWWVNR
ncbi:membrane protein, partial [Litorilinea aerophila]